MYYLRGLTIIRLYFLVFFYKIPNSFATLTNA